MFDPTLNKNKSELKVEISEISFFLLTSIQNLYASHKNSTISCHF